MAVMKKQYIHFILDRELIRLYALVSGGFAIVQPDSQLSINAVEGFPLEDFSSEVGHES